jgi:hypothetical protein
MKVQIEAKEKVAAKSHSVKKESFIAILTKECPSEEKVNSQKKSNFGPQKPQGLKFE